MPYNLSGAELNTAYNYTASELSSVFDLNGIEYSFSPLEPVLFSDIPEYFQSDVTNALTYINNLSNDYVNYIVVTDTHYDLSTTRNTAKIFNYLYQEGRFDKLIHLGDIVDGGGFDDTGWQYLLEDDWWHFKGHWLFTQGNHDSAWSTSLAELASNFETTNNIRYTINTSHNIYYYDNPTYKIRFIGSHHYNCLDDKDTLESYIKAAINRGYKWAILCHYKTDTSSEEWRKAMVETYGNFICSLSGHNHWDNFNRISTGTKTLLDLNLEADIQGRQYAGTNQEQCITLVSINPTTEIIKLYRIGLSRAYEGVKQWEFTGFGN